MKHNTLNDRKERKIELLAPAGSMEAGYAALHYGADAIYLGLANFSARAAAINFTMDELADIAGYAHSLPRRRKIYIAVNTLVLQNELDALVDLLADIAAIGIDAVIIQDLGVLNILHRYFPQVKVHASTQMAIHNLPGAKAARELGMARVTLARELTMVELAEIAAKSGIETEVFVHGALCYSYSGLCLFSSHLYGRSGNRGKCAYPCREWFKLLSDEDLRQHAQQKDGFIFSMKDLALPDYVVELGRVGVKALKIEGRMKSPLYVAAAVNYYRKLIDGCLPSDQASKLASDIKTIFSRPWTDLYLKTRRNRSVIDAETQGHRGAPAGRVEEVAKNSGGHCLRFRTDLPIELHDGLQIDIAGLPRPFGFAVKSINISGDGRIPGKKRVFTAPAGARVEVQLPSGHPAIPRGAVIYSSSSQKVKQQYVFFTPKVGQSRLRQAADFDIQVKENGLDVTAAVNVFPGVKGEKDRVETQKHFDGIFEPAKNIGQVDEAITTAFGKLGGTVHLKTGQISVSNPHNLFIPISLLNSIRRDISAALEQEIAALPGKYAAGIKSKLVPNVILPSLNAVIPDMSRSRSASGLDRETSKNQNWIPASAGMTEKDILSHAVRDRTGLNFKWSIKTDQPHLLEAFEADDWRDVDEVIVECAPNLLPGFIEQLDRVSVAAGKARLRLALPAIMRLWETGSFAKTIPELIAKGRHSWQVSNPGGWALLNKMAGSGAMLNISSDWPLYVMNIPAALQLKKMGMNKFTLSPEDSFENMRVLLDKFSEFSSMAVVIVYQDTPLMVSESCVFASERCSRQNGCDGREMAFLAPHGEEILVISRACRSIVLNRRPFCLAAHLKELAAAGAVNFRADFINREYSGQEALDIWRQLRSGAPLPLGHNANFNRGMN